MVAHPLLQRGVQVLRRKMKAAAGVTVQYSSVMSGETYSVVLVPGRNSSGLETAEGMLLTDLAQDFKLKVTDLPVAPNYGDTVSWGGRRYELLHPGGGREYEYSGNYNESWRLHFKLVPPAVVTDYVYGDQAGFAYKNLNDMAYEVAD